MGVRLDVVDFSVGRNERRITSKIIIGEFTGFSINLIFCRVVQCDLQGDAGCLQSFAGFCSVIRRVFAECCRVLQCQEY